jgi:tetratricopeptide (TPR) repeat protein
MNERRRFLTVNCLAGLLLTLTLFGGLGCSSSPTVQDRSDIDEEFERTSRAARMAFDTGKLQQAVGLYQQALERAYILDNSQAIVNTQYNLAVCLAGLQSYDKALEKVRQAESELADVDQSIPADILLLEATLLYHLDRQEEARRLTDQVLTESNPISAAVQSKAHFLRGLMAARRGDTQQLRQEIVALGKPATAGLRADREELVGRLSMAEGNWNEALEAFDRTAELRRDDFDYSEMVNALALAAWVCEQAGKLSEASKRYLRAGRSAARQERNRDALNWLNRAEKLAGEAGDEPTARQARSYRLWLESP